MAKNTTPAPVVAEPTPVLGVRSELASFRPTNEHADAAAHAGHSVDGLVRLADQHLSDAANAIRQLASLAGAGDAQRLSEIAERLQ